MNATHDFERRMADYYATEAPTRAPDRVVEQALGTIVTTPQRRAWLGRSWRLPPRAPVAKVAVGALAIVVVGLVALTVARGTVTGPAASPSPSPAILTGPTSSEAMWPQSSLEEVRQAQALADAGDPAYAWQVSRTRSYQPGQNHPMSTEFFARFIEEELGWEKSLWTEDFAHPDGLVDGDVVYVRCAPGGNDSRYPEPRCAPTIDEARYERVRFHVAQLVRQDESGIWVVTGWEMIEPAGQATPPSEAEITAFLAPFLQARIDGEGADDFAEIAGSDPFAGERVAPEIPLLYATSAGAHYERSEFEIVGEPEWPSGRMQLELRLFAANDETVVEQLFWLERHDTGRLRLVYDYQPMEADGPVLATREEGKAVPGEYTFLDGEVTYRAGHPLAPSTDGYRAASRVAVEGLLPDDDAPRRVLVMVADPRPVGPGCADNPALDAEALARSIGSDPAVEATGPVNVTIGGIPALRMDVVLVRGAGDCSWGPFLLANAHPNIDRARIHLVDLPGRSGRVLAIATITDEDSFETVLEWAGPVVDSIEFYDR